MTTNDFKSIYAFQKTLTSHGQTMTTYFDKKGRVQKVEACMDDTAPDHTIPLVSIIDHTLLKPDATAEQVEILCEQALKYHFGAVCVNSYWVAYCKAALAGSSVKVGATIGFPLGAMSTKAKVFDTKQSIKDGATEIDMVINIGELKSGNLAAVANDIREVVRVAHKMGAIVKVILETCLLTDEEKVTACLIAKEAGADFVKTSTGFSTGGATIEDIRLMRSVVGPEMGVKASGGIRSLADAQAMIEAGATRIGTSGGVKMAEELAAQQA